MLQAFLDELVESYRVHKKSSINSINYIVRNMGVLKNQTVDSVSGNRIFVLRFQNDSRNVKMLGVLQSFIDPGLEHLC